MQHSFDRSIDLFNQALRDIKAWNLSRELRRKKGNLGQYYSGNKQRVSIFDFDGSQVLAHSQGHSRCSHRPRLTAVAMT